MLRNPTEIIAQDESNEKALSDELIQELRAPSNAFNKESSVSLQMSEDSIKANEKENTIQRLRAENDALLQEMDIMVKDKQSLTKERDHATAEHADLMKQVGVWSVQLESFTELQQAKDKELDVLCQRLALMETHSNASDKSRRQAETQLQESQQNIKALMDENKKMKGVVDAQQKKIKMVLAASQQDQKEKEKCIADKETLTKERDVVKKAHAELVKQLDIWTQEFEVVSELQAAGDKHAAELYRQLNCCKEELTRCQRDLVQATSEKHTAKNELTAEIDALRPRLVMMEQHNYSMVQSLGEAEARLAASKVENGEKEKRIRELTMEHDTLRGLMEEQNNKSLEEARAMALSRLEESEQTVLMKENCIQALMDLNKEMNSVVVSLQRECEMVLAMSKQDNMEKEKRIRELTVELENARGNAKDLTAELHELKAEIDALQPRLVMMEQHNYSMVQSLGEAGTRLASSKEFFHERMALMEEHIKEMKTIVDAQQQEIAMSMKDMKEAWTLHEKSRQDYKDVIKKEEMRTELIQDLRAQAGALRQEMDIMVKNKICVETLKAELEASNGEVQVVKKEHVESQRACMDTRKMLEDKEVIHAKVCHEFFSQNSLLGSFNLAHSTGFLTLCILKS
jgi:septal ring factor EnvC (AmiA/AmiB activator)